MSPSWNNSREVLSSLIFSHRRRVIVLAAVLLFTTAPYSPAGQSGGNSGRPGKTILETDDISVVIEGEGIWLRITPLEGDILRYCTEDTKKMYATMLAAHPEITPDTEEKIFLLHFQGREEPETYFDPTSIDIIQQGRRYRPIRIIPHTPDFDKRVLPFFGTPEMALYFFSRDIDFEFPMTFRYRELSNRDWEEVIKKIDDAQTLYGTNP